MISNNDYAIQNLSNRDKNNIYKIDLEQQIQTANSII